jgi:D-amino-acid dehydrogenase
MHEYAELGAPLAASGLLGRHDLADREPSLAAGARAGFLVEHQWSIDPGVFVDGLAERLRASGVTILEGARVTSVEDAGSRVVVHTTGGSVDGDAAVVAAGIWTRQVCRTLGLDLNIFPGKGYSFSVSAERQPRQLIHLGDAHVGVAPLANKVRIAGTMEFDRDHDRFHARRIDAIVAAARPYLDGIDWDARQDEWVGPRPMTPDGLPAIGTLPGHPNVLVAAGHNMLGLMLSPATGRLVGDLLTGRRDQSEVPAFEPARLARRTGRRQEPAWVRLPLTRLRSIQSSTNRPRRLAHLTMKVAVPPAPRPGPAPTAAAGPPGPARAAGRGPGRRGRR